MQTVERRQHAWAAAYWTLAAVAILMALARVPGLWPPRLTNELPTGIHAE